MLLSKFDGLTVSLLDEAEIEDFTFHGQSVSATLGSDGGPLCAPILAVTFTSDDSIIIQGQGIEILWRKIEIAENEIRVNRNGKPVIYAITGKNLAKAKRRLP